ncbi:MAG: RrF2 family transcriptional regulator [Aminipila sp.]
MQFSVGVEYAIHSLFYMICIPTGKTVAIKELAELNGLTETYLSKIFTKLRKGGIVRSVSGVKGGYELAKGADEISFWDIVESIEGSSYMFQCAEIRQNNIFGKNDMVVDQTKKMDKFDKPCPCLIKVVMVDAEEQMRNYLREKSLQWLFDHVIDDFTDSKKEEMFEWARNR